jgi:glucokinase
MHKFSSDPRIVMTLDAGRTNFRFAAIRGGEPVVRMVVLPSSPNDLKACIQRLVEGFRRVKDNCPEPPAAISFAFPGPGDYPRGIIGDLGNLPCFHGGVPLGAILEDEFEIPTFINNDGDLFAYGEAIGGFLPWVNDLLAKSGSPKRFQNLLGVTIGTGFGGGIVHNNELFLGDNSMAAELWLSRNKFLPAMNVEESVSIRAVRRVYEELAGRSLFAEALMPDEIYKIANGLELGNEVAAMESFRRLGEAAGDAIANALTLIDGLVVIGGGLSGAAPLFLPALVAELNGEYVLPDGKRIHRLASRAFNLEDDGDLKLFLEGRVRQIEVRDYLSIVPRPTRPITHDSLPRIGVGLSRLGTSEAVALGAYVFALQMLVRKKPIQC